MGLNSSNRWEIDNELLHSLLTYGDGRKRVAGLEACWSIGHGFYIVKGAVTWLTMRALKIERLPWMADWPFSFMDYDHKKFVPLLDYMRDNPAVVDDACLELQRIYKHTQDYYTGKTHLPLGRGYKNFEDKSSKSGDYAKTLYRHAQAASLLRTLEINVPHDVITSWGRSSNYSNCVVGVEMNIPVKNILLSSETIAPRKNEIQHNAIESDEFLVLNRNWDGMLKVPVSSVIPLNGFQIKVPESMDEAKKELMQPMFAYRTMTNYNVRESVNYKAPQTFKSRLSRAREILFTKYQ